MKELAFFDNEVFSKLDNLEQEGTDHVENLDSYLNSISDQQKDNLATIVINLDNTENLTSDQLDIYTRGLIWDIMFDKYIDMHTDYYQYFIIDC